MRNPAWTRDELILALELYFRCDPLHTSEKNPEIIKLSKTLNSLPFQGRVVDSKLFRNPNGVYMKLCNFLRLDPSYKGSGLRAGGKLEVVIWNEYANNKERLSRTARAIKDGANLMRSENVVHDDVQEEEVFQEGRVLSVLHRRRERSPKLIRNKKEQVLNAKGKLACEVCSFDFGDFYGEIGRGFAECHHKVPLSELPSSAITRLQDLAIVCANCHRILHKTRPPMTVEGMREHLLISASK